MSLQAYQRTQRTTESPRDTEYRLFGLVTGSLMEAEGAPRTDPRLIRAIDWNRRMWSTLAADCAGDGNALPKTVRAQIISLSLWVSRYSSEVMRNGAPLEPLIDVNRSIMQGLAARAEPQMTA
ncbi:MAG: flagellar biosynthesis regulator FlaF [Alphaproteobacteria bacterium]|nr:flagellar biosynthesis regulator FlaF [Alphaproteobacteria bacterium]